MEGAEDRFVDEMRGSSLMRSVSPEISTGENNTKLDISFRTSSEYLNSVRFASVQNTLPNGTEFKYSLDF